MISKKPIWAKALRTCAEPQRAAHFLELLAVTGTGTSLASASPEQARILCALFSGSQALSNWLVANSDAIAVLTPEALKHPRRDQGLRREVDAWLEPLLNERDYETAFARLRQFKQTEMLRIAARDLARLTDVTVIIRELSDVADVCLESVWRLCSLLLTERLGHPRHQDAEGRWHSTKFCVLGLGKLGGQELNYSSDVDVMFIYSGEGAVSKAPDGIPSSGAVANHQFFNRLAEMFIAEVSSMTQAGALYRIDLRLRPEGDAGPLSRSLASCENYYAQWGQTWERMMLIKARCVAGDQGLAAEFLEIIQPFRHPRSLAEGVMREVAAMKERIENEVVKAGELDRNVKLGRGGIREIEFIAQTLQLIHAGRMPFLQGAQTLPTLQKLTDYELLPRDDAAPLTEAYCFLRDVEHRLQMEDNQQTHTIPQSRPARERLAALMGFKTLPSFESQLKTHTKNVRRVYDRLLKSASPESRNALPRQIEGSEAEWKNILAEHSFRDPEQAVRLLQIFAHGPGYVHVSSRTGDLAIQLITKFLALCPKRDSVENENNQRVLSDPDRVLTRLDSFVDVYGARATLFEAWNNNPLLFELLILLFDRSEHLAEVAIHEPELVDELVTSERLRQRKNTTEILRDLRHGAKDKDQRLWIRRYHQAELMRIALREILGLADFERNLVELSALAEACLQYTLEIVLRKNKLRAAPLVIIGLGKLGGAEINYGSDLDLLFVTGAPACDLPKLQRIAIDVMDLLSSRTALGIAFATDARLRPDGEKGLLVNTLAAYESYYRQRAQLWEIQSISRSRPVAGDLKLGEQFQKLVATITDFSPKNVAANFGLGAKTKSSSLMAYSPDWKDQIRKMRRRIERERTPAGQDALAIKTGAGGLMDAEFLAQMFCLENGWMEPNTLRALERARDSKILPKKDADALIENYRALRRVEVILRRWSFEGETVLPEDEPAFYRVAVRCGFRNTEDFRAALAGYRRRIREVFKDCL